MSSKKGVDLMKSFNTFMRNSKGYDSVMKNVSKSDNNVPKARVTVFITECLFTFQ